jgi:hypothetical protein
MNGSGKQILLKILSELSTRVLSNEDLEGATRRVRTGLLLHGSTAEESFEHASRIAWTSDRDQAGHIDRQGMALENGEVFIADLYETAFSMPGLRDFVLQEHPKMTEQDYDAFEWILWLLVSGVQMFSQLNPAEASHDIDIDRWVESMMKHYDHHFKGRTKQEPGTST